MFIRPKKYDLEKLNQPRELTKHAKLFFPGGKVKKRQSLTMKKHQQRMYKKRLDAERLAREREHHMNPSKRERMQAQQNLFGLKRRVVDRLLQKKAGNGLGKKRQDTRVLLQAYKEIDANKDGGVSYDEFEHAVGPNHLDIGLSKEEVHQLCIACDIDGNGDITFEEFLQTLIFADKPETQLMLDRARKRESKFLQDTVNKPVCVKPIKKIRNSVSTSPLARGGVRTSSSLKDVNSLLNYNDMSNTLVKINGNSKSQPNLSAIVNCPRPMTTSPVRTGCHSPLNPIASLTKRSISTAGTNFKASRNNHGTSNFSFIDDDFDAKNPLETYATMSRQREKHLDPSLNFKSKSKRFDNLFYIDPNALNGRNGRQELDQFEINSQRSNRPMTTLSKSTHEHISSDDGRPTTTAYLCRNDDSAQESNESGRFCECILRCKGEYGFPA